MLKFEGKLKIPHRNLLLCIFSGGFLLGIVLTNVFGKSYVEEMGILSDYFIQRYKYVTIENLELFYYIFRRRAITMVAIWAMGFSALGVGLVWICVAWFGFSLGTLLTASVIRFGIRGVLFSVGAILPHYIVYIPVWILLIRKVYGTCLRIYYPLKVTESISRKKIYIEYVGVFILLFLVCVVGMLLESYVNPILFKKILRII